MELEKSLHEQRQMDLRSLLSVIADSAKVEVWIISQDLIELLPLHVQNVIVTRLSTKQSFNETKISVDQKPKEV